jgi:hypothetical protein
VTLFPKLVAKRVAEDMFPYFENAPASICSKLQSEILAARWMRCCGFPPSIQKKSCLITDGHERPDVVVDRAKFLELMAPLRSRMKIWSAINDFQAPFLGREDRQVVIVTHDECLVYSNDCVRMLWEERDNREMRPKSAGSSLHISGFCCQCCKFITAGEGAQQRKSFHNAQVKTEMVIGLTKILWRSLRKLFPCFKRGLRTVTWYMHLITAPIMASLRLAPCLHQTHSMHMY